jgi:hypothetical protein
MRRSHYTLLLLLFVCAGVASAQEDYAEQTSKFKEKEPNVFEQETIWGVGLQAGLLSGSGLGVRYHPAGRFGFQLVGGYITLPSGLFTTEKSAPFSIGAEGQFDFDARGLSRFYGYIGLGYYSLNKEDDEGTAEDESADDLAGPFRLGLGIAYEWPLSSKIIFNANIGFTYFSDGAFWPAPQFGLFYYFN